MRNWYFVLIDVNGDELERWKVPKDECLSIGRKRTRSTSNRHDEQFVRLSGKTISRSHATISQCGSFLYVEDLNSSYGTYMDEQPLTGCKKLSEAKAKSCSIRFGEDESQRFRFKLQSEADASVSSPRDVSNAEDDPSPTKRGREVKIAGGTVYESSFEDNNPKKNKFLRLLGHGGTIGNPRAAREPGTKDVETRNISLESTFLKGLQRGSGNKRKGLGGN